MQKHGEKEKNYCWTLFYDHRHPKSLKLFKNKNQMYVFKTCCYSRNESYHISNINQTKGQKYQMICIDFFVWNFSHIVLLLWNSFLKKPHS